MSKDYSHLFKSFNKVDLNAIKNVSLMSRVDEKFVFHESKLFDILSQLSKHYNILLINNKMVQEYHTLYLDTDDRLFFHQHHNGYYARNKVRFRKYVDSGLCFLEIKHKNNKKITIKKRIQVDSIPDKDLTSVQKDYIDSILEQNNTLLSQQTIYFQRMTFVHNNNLERLTIDINLSYSYKNQKGEFKNLVIAELKKGKSQPTSDFKKILKKNNINPLRLSKYCMTTLMLDKSIKYNRFKEKLLLINKIIKP